MIFGYHRVREDEGLDAVKVLREHHAEKIFIDDHGREFANLVKSLRSGDIVKVLDLRHFGTSLANILERYRQLVGAGAALILIEMPVSELGKSNVERLMAALGVANEIQNEIYRIGQRKGVAKYVASGSPGGPDRKLDWNKIVWLVEKENLTYRAAAEKIGCSRHHVYRIMRSHREGKV
jgi:DNA invertase Pin-like site-specific DNA recombinase